MMCCYYPTTTIAIDDDSDFLGVLTQHLDLADCIPYSSPQNAIDTLISHNPPQRIHERVIKGGGSTDIHSVPEDQAFVYNIRGLHEEIYSGDRFNDVSVIIVDYYMNEMNGIEVCEALAKHPAKKILLTGGADKESLAIDAFNKGIIHRFISKTDADFPNKIKQAVFSCKEAYFRDFTASLISHLPSASTNLYQYPPYVNFTKNLQDQKNAVEHYIIDGNGSSLMLDVDGNPSWLVIRSESDMKELEEIARDSDASANLILDIADRIQMPFFFSDNDFQQSASDWDKLFYPCQRFPGVPNYYYSVFDGYKNSHINNENIISYSSHQKLES